MKKVLFLQNGSNQWGGVWFVNKAIGEELIKLDYDVEILGIRKSSNNELEHNPKLKTSTINTTEPVEITHFTDIKNKIKEKRIVEAIKLTNKKIKQEYILKNDYHKLAKYIIDNKIDYIIVTHYEILDAIPKQYLNKTIYVHHSTFDLYNKNKSLKKHLDKYKDKIKYVWLSKSAYELAIKAGFKNSTYIYNPVRIRTDERSNVNKNKTLITLARLSSEKRLDIMIEIASKVLNKNKDWHLKIYGDGDLKEELTKKIDNDRIKLCGKTNDVEKVLKEASINLNTSLFEGFAMGILEADELGVPTITFNNSESLVEEITDKTGIIVKMNDKKEFENELNNLINGPKRLEEMSKESKKFVQKFYIENIVKEWVKLFNEL